MHNLYIKRDVQCQSSLSPFSSFRCLFFFPCSFLWHAGGNVWICGGSVEKCWYKWRLQLQLMYIENLLFQSVNSGKRSVIRTFFFTITHDGQIGLPQWFFSPCWIHCHQPNCCFLPLPFTSINPFYICFDQLWFLYNIAKFNISLIIMWNSS